MSEYKRNILTTCNVKCKGCSNTYVSLVVNGDDTPGPCEICLSARWEREMRERNAKVPNVTVVERRPHRKAA